MDHTIPNDAVNTQREWTATYERLARQPGRTALRRRLYRLSVRLAAYPLSPAARVELRRRARDEEAGRD
ncbi:hypothetical protein [Streptomyces sp. NBC_01445]|uniref:hypothetical protein n=1 Tax=Streptomyces sp. NBC_01445 TaxID=2903869 RepID=UPI002DDC7D86|nr:hypothetical protein [Streptomyces sp. NBC_01445]WSE04851.1 hypothetical protein OG574_16670 [Streptomyces sp. NBC_01445]